jgi:hypothetical protein
MDEGMLAILLTGLIVFVPLAGLTMRFALKPLIDSLIRVVEARRPAQELALLEKRLALVEHELSLLRSRPGEPVGAGEAPPRLAAPRE